MAGLTREQRAAKAAQKTEKPAQVLMERDGKTTEVRNNESVQIMQALGWRLVN
jgi:hypothetical protein